MLVQAIAYKSGMNDSTVASANYIISNYVWAQYDSGTKASCCYNARQLSNGKVIASGWIDNTSLAKGKDVLLVRFNSDGTLDTTFGSGGAFTWNSPYSKDDSASIMGVDTSGNIYLVGGGVDMNNDSYTDGYVLRVTSSGSLDTTYGSGSGYFTQSTQSGRNTAFGATVDPATGNVYTGVGPFNSIYTARYYKFNSSGVQVTSGFGSGSYYEWTGDGWTNYTGGPTYNSGTGAIYCSTYSFKNADNANSWGGVFKLSTAGALDTSFGASGWAKWPPPPTTPVGANAGGSATFLSSGKILIGGRRAMGGAHYTAFLGRYTSAGAIDSSFASSGTYVVDVGNSCEGCSAVADATEANYLLFIYADWGTGGEYAASKITNTGVLVSAFGSSGYRRNSVFTGGGVQAFLYGGFAFVGTYNNKMTILYVDSDGH
jgi:uncharacterized delta-60 repeat protein